MPRGAALLRALLSAAALLSASSRARLRPPRGGGARGPSPQWEPLLELPPDARRRGSASEVHLFPQPASVRFRGGEMLDVSPALVLASVGAESPELTAALARASARLFPFGAGAEPRAGALALAAVDVRGGGAPLGLGADESYVLAASGGGIAITAGSHWGALHALETLTQLVLFNESSQTYCMPALSLADAPRFPHRGVLLDVARHFLTPAAIRAVVDIMAADKLNALHLHLSDDDAWPLALASLPLLARGAYSPRHRYSADDMRGIVAYARARGVRVLPEVDAPAHMSVVEEAYPELLATAADGRRCALDPSNPRTWEFLAAVWRELADIFQDAHVHVGGDEVDAACWDDDARVQRWAARRGLRDARAVYAWFMRRLLRMVRGAGKRAIAWHEAAAAGPFDTAVTLDVWSGFYSGSWQDDVAHAVRLNATVILSGPFYVTGTERSRSYQRRHNTWETMYSTQPLDFPGGDKPENAARVLGGQVCLWGDAAQVDSGDVFMTLAPYAHAVAELLWSPEAVTRQHGAIAKARERMHFHRCRLGVRGFPSHPIFFAGAPPCPVPFSPLFEPLHPQLLEGGG